MSKLDDLREEVALLAASIASTKEALKEKEVKLKHLQEIFSYVEDAEAAINDKVQEALDTLYVQNQGGKATPSDFKVAYDTIGLDTELLREGLEEEIPLIQSAIEASTG